MTQVTPHFAWHEFESYVPPDDLLSDKRGKGTEAPPLKRDIYGEPTLVRANVQFLALQLEILRAELGDHPITIASGWRSPEYNEWLRARDIRQYKRRGIPRGDWLLPAKRSKHLYGMAADIVVDGFEPTEVAAAIEKLVKRGCMEPGGLRAYRRFVHYDTRGELVTW